MSRFIDLDIAYVNVDYIIRVEGHPDHSAEVYMIDGTMFRCPYFDFEDLEEENHIVGVSPCQDVEAIYENDEGDLKVVPVRNLVVTAKGKVWPLALLSDDDRDRDDGTFLYLRERT